MNNLNFSIHSGRVAVSDPCYDDPHVFPAKTGAWTASLQLNSEGRIAELFAFAEGSEFHDLKPIDLDFGVDSGQFGLFDDEIYISGTDFGEPGFYNDCCQLTIEHPYYGVVDCKGIVTSSGWGDGCYNAFGSFIDGVLHSFNIVFIEEGDL